MPKSGNEDNNEIGHIKGIKRSCVLYVIEVRPLRLDNTAEVQSFLGAQCSHIKSLS